MYVQLSNDSAEPFKEDLVEKLYQPVEQMHWE